MIRTQIYLTEQERDALRALAAEGGKKQSELIREAIDSMIGKLGTKQRKAVISRVAGMWKDRKDLPDFRSIRSEWDRHSLS
jgi:metal-responsive CopG/Arc/MetJ family transcriptional regulator